MSNPAVETKIELVTEAIELLVLATAVALGSGDRAAHHQNVADARRSVHDALRELLTPTLRVFTNPTPPIPETVPYGGKGIDGMNLA